MVAASRFVVICCRYDSGRRRDPGLARQFRITSSPGFRTGRARIMIASMTLYIAVFAPMPSASDSTAMPVNNGVLAQRAPAVANVLAEPLQRCPAPHFANVSPSAAARSRNRDGWPVRLLRAGCLNEFAPPLRPQDRERSRRRDRHHAVSIAKNAIASLVSLCRTHHAGDRTDQKLPFRLLSHQLLFPRRSQPVILCPPVQVRTLPFR